MTHLFGQIMPVGQRAIQRHRVHVVIVGVVEERRVALVDGLGQVHVSLGEREGGVWGVRCGVWGVRCEGWGMGYGVWGMGMGNGPSKQTHLLSNIKAKFVLPCSLQVMPAW